MSDTKIKTSNIGNLAVTHALLHTDMDLTSKTVQVGTPTADAHPATKAYVDTEVANLIDTAPSTLDTLNELAAALGDDADFSNTITGSIATKLPLAGGTLTGNVTFGDNNKAIFGAGSDLQIYHDATSSHSVIAESGGGSLFLRGQAITMQNADGSKAYFGGNGDVATAYHGTSAKLATTPTGVDVTGTVTADGLTVDGDATINASLPNLYMTETDTTDLNTRIALQAGVQYLASVNDDFSVTKNRISWDNSTGDISFYEDTGTTAKFFWDASAEKLGIGTTPNNKLTLSDGSTSYTGHGGGTYLEVVRGSGADAGIILNKDTGQWMMGIDNSDGTNPPLRFEYSAGGSAHAGLGNGTVGLTLNYQGNVGIGTSSPSTALQVDGTVTATAFSGDGSALSGVGFTGFPTNATDLASPSEGDAYYNTTDDVVKFYTGSSWIPLTGTINRYDYTATANQTTFAAVYSGSNVDVYLNGIKLVAATDYTASNGTSVVMTSGVEVGDLVNIVAQTSSFSAPPASVPATGGTFTGNVILSGASTNLTVGNTVESSNLRLTNAGDLTMAGSGHAFQIGPTSARNLAMDNNEIMARNNGVGAELHLNPDGGDVTINNQGSLSSGSKLVVRNRIELGDSTNANTKPTALLHIHKDINTGSAVTLAEAPSIVLSENEVAGAGNQGYHGAYWFGSQDTSTPADFNWYVAGMASQSGGGDTGPATSSGNLEFYTTPLNTGTPTKSMELSINGHLSVTSGRFSAPAQPAFEAVKTTDTIGTASAMNYLRAFDSMTFQTGNIGSTGMSLSTGQYTAPADGLYHFSCTMTWDGGDGGDDSFGIGFVITNNSTYYNYNYTNNDGFRMNPRWETTNGQEMMVTISKTCRLAAGAKIGLWMRDVDHTTINLQHAEFGGFKFA